MNYSKLINKDELQKRYEKTLTALRENPDSIRLKYRLANIYNNMGRFEEALMILDKIPDFELNVNYEKVKSYVFLNDFENALRELDKMYDIISNSGMEMSKSHLVNLEKVYMLCLDKIEVLNEDYVPNFPGNRYFLKQLFHYNDADFVINLEYIRDKHLEKNRLTFKEDIDLRLLVSEIRDAIVSANRVSWNNSFDDEYYFYYPNTNSYNDCKINLITVKAILGTDKLLYVFPTTSFIDEENINYYDFKSNKVVEEKPMILEKRMSQIDKFNKKYNLS